MAFRTIDAATLEDWVRSEPTGAYSRRAWFLYEALTGRTLDVGDARSGNYVEALDPKKFVVAGRHDDVPALMGGWMKLTRRVSHEKVPPVVAAAVSAFAFVFVHPFDDGNGRIHRFLIHHVLASQEYTPKEFILPVSAAILRDRRGYDEVLESFSRPILEYIE